MARAARTWNPAWSTFQAPVSLTSVGGFNTGFAIIAIADASFLWNSSRRNTLRRALTWDCGYVAPGPRMQFTAGSFAGIITEWFRWILQPRRAGQRATEAFPTHASFDEHTPETVLEAVVEPSSDIIMRIATAARRLQHGRVQTYIAYVVVGITGLAAVALLGGQP